MDITIKDLQNLQQDALDNPLPPEEAAQQWLKWFEKRAERILKASASFGHSYTTLDLPLELSSSLHKQTLKPLLTRLKSLLIGCVPSIVEEEYEGRIIFRIEISWANTPLTPPNPTVPTLPTSESEKDATPPS